MSVAKEIKQLEELVRDLLTSEPKYRDSNKMLSAKIWAIQLGGYANLKNITAYDFLAEYVKTKNSKLYSQESIGRTSRRLQEENESLQGKKYKLRKEHQVEVVEAVYNVK